MALQVNFTPMAFVDAKKSFIGTTATICFSSTRALD
jgi:hypothetical protein